jgi:hypothetical protein
MPRLRGGWQWVALALVILNFGLPFTLLLWRAVKQSPAVMIRLAALLLVMQLVFAFYQVVPAFHPEGLSRHWMDFVAPVAMGGFWLACFLWQLGPTFSLPQNEYFEGGRVDVYEIYHRWNY